MCPLTVDLLAVFALLSASCCSAAHEQELVLALEDTFDDFNLSLWKHEITLGGGGNWEFQWYTNNRTNSYVKDGVLHIRPTLTADDIGEDAVRSGTANVWGAQPANLCTGNAFFGCERNAAFGNVNNPVRSARIRTAESFSFTYGKVEVRAKLPRGDWLWPAIWMLPTDYQYGEWPASGEIDIMESRGNPPSYPPGGSNTFGSTLHWGMNYRENRFFHTHQVHNGSTVDFASDFHTYGLIWNETYIGTYLDDESNRILDFPITQPFFELGEWNESNWWNPWEGRGNNAPFDRRFFLVINLAVGGVNFFPDGFGKPWNNTQESTINDFYAAVNDWWPTWTQSFQIDSVRVWTFQEPETTDCPTSDSTVIQLVKSNVFGVLALAIALSVGMFKFFN